MNRLFVFFLSLTFTFKAFAQDTTVVASTPVTEIAKPHFLTLDLGFDYPKLLTFVFPNEDKYEGLAAINFGFGLSIDGEYGCTKKSPKYMYKNGTYTVEGNYYKMGLGYNTILGENNIIGLGFRYARSEFEDYTTYTILSTVFEPLNYSNQSNPNKVSAQWAELVLKTEGPIKKIKNLKFGMFVRLKYLDPLKDKPEYELFPVQLIPGYGVAKANATGSVNLYIKYSIPIIK